MVNMISAVWRFARMYPTRAHILQTTANTVLRSGRRTLTLDLKEKLPNRLQPKSPSRRFAWRILVPQAALP